jgi:hypothetical protein
MPLQGAAKVAYERERRARLAQLAGREPHQTGRPATGRTTKHHGDRSAQRARARHRLLQRRGANGSCVTDHPIMTEAIAVARKYAKPDPGHTIFDPLYEEAVCVAALAICEGHDPHLTTQAFVRAERDLRYRWAPLLEDAA